MAGQKKDLPKRKLVVTELREKSRGESDHGEWVLHEVSATTEDGSPVDAKMITFKGDEIKVGELITYELEKKVHEKYGDQFVVYPPRKDLKKSLDEVRARVDALEHEVSSLKQMLSSAPAPAAGAAAGPPAASSGSQSGVTAPGSRTLVEPKPQNRQGTADDDIPF